MKELGSLGLTNYTIESPNCHETLKLGSCYRGEVHVTMSIIFNSKWNRLASEMYFLLCHFASMNEMCTY